MCSSWHVPSSSGGTHAQHTRAAIHATEHAQDETQGVAQDVAQDVTQDVAQGVAEDVLGAAENVSAKVLIVPVVIFQRRKPRPTHAHRPRRCPLVTREGHAREGRGAGRGGGHTTENVTQDSAFEARAARAILATPSPPPPRLAKMEAQLGSSVAFGSGCGQALPGMPRKAPLCL